MAYLEENAELEYAGNVYVSQGRTVDTAHLVVVGDRSAAISSTSA